MRHMSAKEISEIAETISTFRGTITWADVIAVGVEVTGERYSRTCLVGKDEIRIVYELLTGKTAERPGEKYGSKPKSKELVVMEATLERLVAEGQLKDAIIAQLSEQYIVWAENARKRGLTEADLNGELPKVRR